MNGSRAKAIRKQVYGDKADVRKYYQGKKSGQIICPGLRATYQNIKKQVTRKTT